MQILAVNALAVNGLAVNGVLPLYIASKSVLYTPYSVKKCLIDSLSVPSEVPPCCVQRGDPPGARLDGEPLGERRAVSVRREAYSED